MRIASIETVLFDLPTSRPHKLSMATISTHSMVLVRIRDQDGREGLGEAAIIPHYASETIEGVKIVIDEYLGPHLIGSDPSSLEALHLKMGKLIKDNLYAKAAVEMACVDLVATAWGVPAAVLFGGAVRDRIEALWVLGTGDLDRDVAEAEQHLAERLHRLFLVKVGKDDPATDVARVRAVRKALGDRAKVYVDANQAWDEVAATWAIERLEDLGVSVVEQPLPKANIEGMRRLANRFTVPIMADEAVDSLESAMAFARTHAADAFSVKVTKHGGMLPTKKVAAVAEADGISLFGGTMLEGAIGTSAFAQTFATMPRLDWGCQLFGPLLLTDDITVDRPAYEDFHLIVPSRPGLGLAIDEDKLAHYRRDRTRSVVGAGSVR